VKPAKVRFDYLCGSDAEFDAISAYLGKVTRSFEMVFLNFDELFKINISRHANDENNISN